MESRIQLDLVEPNSYKAMFALEKYLQQSDLKKTHKELIKIRASQINGCAFCIDMHTKEAIENGETPQRIFLLNAWRETNLFTKEERTLLEITEEITLIHKKGLTTETYEKALTVFDQNYLSQIIMAIITINAWNRIAISTNKPIEN
ncbi:carboxymuconolactone decarboxylase family protein [Flavobacterium sp. HNIBRBA15423]|uniref:carboxymuconolactone decarboxylase family protein n=1 Tax=Flavobacterium sp. HNIBRBA15423 TaxID=3458683 RepID=UPI0040443A25